MTSLMKRVQGHTTGQKTSGQNTLALAVECLDHWAGESNDWSPLAYLIGKSEPAQSNMVKRLVAKSIHGFTLTRDDAQVSGLRFKKKKGANQGFDSVFIDKMRALVAAKKSIQSAEVKALVAPAEKPEKPVAEIVQTRADALVKFLHSKDVDYPAIIAAVQAAAQRAQQAEVTA